MRFVKLVKEIHAKCNKEQEMKEICIMRFGLFKAGQLKKHFFDIHLYFYLLCSIISTIR